MKVVRIVLIALLTAAVVMAILSPSLMVGILPQEIIDAASMENFPLLGTCTRIAANLVGVIQGGVPPTFGVVTDALEENFLSDLTALLMVAALSIPVSLLLGFVLYKPLYRGVLMRCVLYVSLNLVSVMIAWILYKQVYFRYLIEGLIEKNVTDETMQTAVNALTQFLSAAAIGTLVIKIALTILAAKVVIGKLVMPLIGTLVRTLLFAFLVALMMLMQADMQTWTVIVPVMLVTLVVSGVSDYAFGS